MSCARGERCVGLPECRECAVRVALRAGAHRGRSPAARAAAARLAVGYEVPGIASLLSAAHALYAEPNEVTRARMPS